MDKDLCFENLNQRNNRLHNEIDKIIGSLSKSSDKNELLDFKKSNQPAITIHDQGKILYADETFAEMVGMPKMDELIGKTLFDFSPLKSGSTKLANKHKCLECCQAIGQIVGIGTASVAKCAADCTKALGH